MTEWYPENYDPKLSADDWQFLLNEEEIFSISDLEIMKRFLEFGLDFFSFNSAKDTECKATLGNLAFAYGETYDFYKDNIISLGKRILNVTSCPVYTDTGDKVHYENILLLEREPKSCAKLHNPDDKMYKLRDELIAALTEKDFSNIQLYTDEKIAEKIKLDESDKQKLEKTLPTVLVDAKGIIPITVTHAADDDKNYFGIDSKRGNKARLIDKVAVSLLAKGFAYKISESTKKTIKSEIRVGRIGENYFKIDAERYKKIKAAIMI